MKKSSAINIACPACFAEVEKPCKNLKGELAGLPKPSGSYHSARRTALVAARLDAIFDRHMRRLCGGPATCLFCKTLPGVQ